MDGCIKLATFCTDTGRLPRICSTATDFGDVPMELRVRERIWTLPTAW